MTTVTNEKAIEIFSGLYQKTMDFEGKLKEIKEDNERLKAEIEELRKLHDKDKEELQKKHDELKENHEKERGELKLKHDELREQHDKEKDEMRQNHEKEKEELRNGFEAKGLGFLADLVTKADTLIDRTQ